VSRRPPRQRSAAGVAAAIDLELRERISLAIVQDRDPDVQGTESGSGGDQRTLRARNTGPRGGLFASVGDRLTAVEAWRTPTRWIAYLRAVFG
jgi:hypothetical protein